MSQLLHLEPEAMSQDEKAFFRAMGARVAELRKSSGIAQVQLAGTMNVSQQTVASWEVGRRRVPVDALPDLARALGTTVEALIGEKAPPAKRGPTPKLQQQMERIARLPRAQQRVVMQMLDGVLTQAGR